MATYKVNILKKEREREYENQQQRNGKNAIHSSNKNYKLFKNKFNNKSTRTLRKNKNLIEKRKTRFRQMRTILLLDDKI